MELFAAVKNQFSRKSLAKSLTEIVAATVDTTKGFLTVTNVQAQKIVAADATLIEVDTASLTGTGEKATISVRASAAGIAAVQAAPALVPAVKSVVPKMDFEIETGIPVPEIKRGGERANAYPFDTLEVGASFFIPESETLKNPAKTLASTVSSATRRFKSATPRRVFTIRGNEMKNGVKGARIWRVAPETATAAQASGQDSTATA
jgi:hypothetical protein